MASPESGFKVWIDQDLCTGDALCAELAPPVFYMNDDNLAYVKDPAGNRGYEGATGTVPIPLSLLDATIESAEECPGECIFIEPV